MTAAVYHSAIFFDLDGTLIEGPFGVGVWPNVLDDLARKTGLERRALYEHIIAENERRQNDESFSALAAMDWDDITAAVAGQLGVRLAAGVCELAAAHAGQARVLDDGARILRQLAAPERALVVATKGLAKYQRPTLDALGLTPLFDAVLTPDVHNALKKQRAFFGDWPERARLCIMVGDRYDDDVEAPAGYGFKTVWKLADLPDAHRALDPFARARVYAYAPEQRAHADAIIVSLGELPDVISWLEQSLIQT
ncbi:MAG: HAD family hydrolase [Chloroflexi bacterium]|nr:HAD family hydrolase [Chloroflexota bacterium]